MSDYARKVGVYRLATKLKTHRMSLVDKVREPCVHQLGLVNPVTLLQFSNEEIVIPTCPSLQSVNSARSRQLSQQISAKGTPTIENAALSSTRRAVIRFDCAGMDSYESFIGSR